jgi:hypothetical protein
MGLRNFISKEARQLLLLYAAILATILWLSSCVTVKEYPLLHNGNNVERLNTSLYTFTLREQHSKGAVYGKAFIAENEIYTAGHVTEKYISNGYDCASLGCSDVYGFNICDIEHGINDIAKYYTDRGRIFMSILDETNFSYKVLCSDNIKRGDSGSPVLCVHGNIIGLISSFYPNSYYERFDGGLIGNVSKLLPKTP